MIFIEFRYFVIEIELFVVVWVVGKVRNFFVGIFFELIVDYRLFILILNSKIFD